MTAAPTGGRSLPGSLSPGEPDADLRSNIAAEARVRIVYEQLINFTGPWSKGNGMKLVQGPAQPIAEATAPEAKKELKNAVKGTPSAKGNPKKSR